MSPARDLGEPLEIAFLGVAETPIIRDRSELTLLKEDLAVVIERANALEGCPDPQAFVDAVELAIKRNKMNELRHHHTTSWLREEKK